MTKKDLLCKHLQQEVFIMKKTKNKQSKDKNQLLREIVENFHSETDTLGSYTGLPNGKDKTPMQDADDL